jgi:hypothetical protein
MWSGSGINFDNDESAGNFHTIRYPTVTLVDEHLKREILLKRAMQPGEVFTTITESRR